MFVNKKHRTVTTIRQLIPFLFVSGILVGGILAVLLQQFAYTYLAGLLLYVLTSLFFAGLVTKSLVKILKVVSVFFTDQDT